MAHPTALLRHDQEAVARMREAVERAAEKPDKGEAVQPELLEKIGEFFEAFVVKCPHGKEEKTANSFVSHSIREDPVVLMPVQVERGARHFPDPTRFHSDCRRRIEMLLASLEAVSRVAAHPLTGETKRALTHLSTIGSEILSFRETRERG